MLGGRCFSRWLGPGRHCWVSFARPARPCRGRGRLFPVVLWALLAASRAIAGEVSRPAPAPAPGLKYAWEVGKSYVCQFTLEADIRDEKASLDGAVAYVPSNLDPKMLGGGQEKGEGSGTAFVVSPDGLLVTCARGPRLSRGRSLFGRQEVRRQSPRLRAGERSGDPENPRPGAALAGAGRVERDRAGRGHSRRGLSLVGRARRKRQNHSRHDRRDRRETRLPPFPDRRGRQSRQQRRSTGRCAGPRGRRGQRTAGGTERRAGRVCHPFRRRHGAVEAESRCLDRRREGRGAGRTGIGPPRHSVGGLCEGPDRAGRHGNRRTADRCL